MLIFIDTEFTDLFDPILISIGMVADGRRQFYAEVPFLVKQCSAFVCVEVLPLLGKEPDAACTTFELRSRILTWLETIRPAGEEIVMCADSQIDLDLLRNALDFRIPGWMSGLHIGHALDESMKNQFYAENGLPRHHALFDAQANRHAYRAQPDLSLAVEL